MTNRGHQRFLRHLTTLDSWSGTRTVLLVGAGIRAYGDGLLLCFLILDTLNPGFCILVGAVGTEGKLR